MKKGVFVLLVLLSCVFVAFATSRVKTPNDSLDIPVDLRLSEKGLQKGNPVFMRIFKEEAVLELWMENKPGEGFALFHTYPICYFSGELGSKTKEGDKQAPEGFYAVGKRQLNPYSNYHKSFNLGYPNKYERQKGYTGDYVMVHGSCVSIGCYAMTDRQIEEIYTLAEAALNKGQAFFRVHIFPFRLTTENLERHKDNKWRDFWLMMKPSYDSFEINRVPPNIEVENGRYIVKQER